MKAFNIVKKIIADNKLVDCIFYLYAHPAQKNWRQINNTLDKKFHNIESGISFDKYQLIEVKGEILLSKNDLEEFNNYKNPVVSFASMFKCSDTINHILMMNLHLDIEINEKELIDILHILIQDRFWLLKTDRYYHIYVNKIVNESDWKKWNYKFLMVDCLVSPRYIGHSLERKFNLLRQNSTNYIKMTTPTVIYDSKEKK